MTINCPCCQSKINISVFAHVSERNTELSAFELITEVQTIVSKVCCMEAERLKSKERKTAVVLVRSIIMYLVRKYFAEKVPLTYLGEFFNRDHTTVMHACQTIGDMVEIWSNLKMEDMRWRIEMLERSESAVMERFPSTDVLKQAV